MGTPLGCAGALALLPPLIFWRWITKPWKRTPIKIAAALVVLLVVAYLGMGYVIYDKLADVKGSCDQYIEYEPDTWVNHPKWPAGFDVTPYHIPTYEAVRFPSREQGIDIVARWIEKEPGAPAVILVHGMGGCKNAIEVLAPAGMLWRNGFSVLLIDLRDVGESSTENGRSSIGNEEYQDVLGSVGLAGAGEGAAVLTDRVIRQLARRRDRALRLQRGATGGCAVPAIHLRQPAASAHQGAGEQRLPRLPRACGNHHGPRDWR